MLDTTKAGQEALKALEPKAYAMLKEYALHHSEGGDEGHEVLDGCVAISFAISARRQADALKALCLILMQLAISDRDADATKQLESPNPTKDPEGPQHG